MPSLRRRAGLVAALAAALALPAPAVAESWPILRVYDGDTFFVAIPSLPPELREVGIRIRGIDTPELNNKAKCDWERRKGAEAKARLTALLGSGPVEFRDLAWDKYGGRIDAAVTAGSRDIAADMIAAGLARPYGGGRRKGWC
jgi:micrococcal nuclease